MSRSDAERLLRTQRDLFQAVATAHDLDQTLRLCLEAALTVTTMECGGLYLVDDRGACSSSRRSVCPRSSWRR